MWPIDRELGSKLDEHQTSRSLIALQNGAAGYFVVQVASWCSNSAQLGDLLTLPRCYLRLENYFEQVVDRAFRMIRVPRRAYLQDPGGI